MECSDTTALSSYVLVNDTLLVNESSPTEENGALYQSSAGNTENDNPNHVFPIWDGFGFIIFFENLGQ